MTAEDETENRRFRTGADRWWSRNVRNGGGKVGDDDEGSLSYRMRCMEIALRKSSLVILHPFKSSLSAIRCINKSLMKTQCFVAIGRSDACL